MDSLFSRNLLQKMRFLSVFVLASSLGAVVSEVLDYSRHERSRILEIEHSSGGLLTVQSPEDASIMVSHWDTCTIKNHKLS